MSVKFMLDSGAYTAFKQGKKIDIDAYADFVNKNADVFDYAINLDVIGDAKASYQNWIYLRKKCNVIPVYHNGTDVRYLEKYIKQTEYLMIGAVASLNVNQRKAGLDYIWKKYLTTDKGLPLLKVHGLGLTDIKIILRYPWFSVDSARAALSAANGRIFLPRIRVQDKKVVFDFENIVIIAVSNQAKVIAGHVGNYLGLPTYQKEIYLDYFNENGFELGKLQYVKQQQKSKKHLRQDIVFDKMFDLEEEDVKEKTLSNDYHSRFLWNLMIGQQIHLRLPSYKRRAAIDYHLGQSGEAKNKTRIYNVVSSPAFIDMAKGYDILISYAYLSDANLSRIKKIKI